MEKRILREMEKNRSVLANSRAGPMPELGGFDNASLPPSKYKAAKAAHQDAQELYPEQDLTPEQIQMFEKQNQDMLKHYESTLDQVRCVRWQLGGFSDANYFAGQQKSLWWRYQSYKHNL